MKFYRRERPAKRRAGILAGSFNPPTRAHLALASAALEFVEEVVFVLPRELPHKSYEGVGFEARLEMLRAALEGHPRFSAAVSGGGLFRQIAEEFRSEHGDAIDLAFICGRDAAERIVGWDYGEDLGIASQLDRYSLLVAARQGSYVPPAELAGRIQPLRLDEEYDAHSATRVRESIARGEAWEILVPPSIVGLVRRHYS